MRIAGVIVCFCAAVSAYAVDGYELIGYGPQHKGTAGTGVASAEDSGWSLVNPAALTTLERRFDIYADTIIVESSITPGGLIANPFSGKQKDFNLLFAPGFGYLWNHGDYTFTVGNFGGAGTRTHYDRPRSLLGIVQNSDRRTELLINRTPFTVARDLGNGWSVGATLQVSAARLRSDSVTLQLRPTEGDYKESYNIGFGFGVGVQKRWDKWSIGASYFSRQWHSDHNEYDDLLSYSLDQPAKFLAGVAYKPNDRLELLLDYKFIEWGDVDQLAAKGVQGGIGWNDQHIFKAGVRYQATDRLKLRFGVSHADSPIDSNNTFMSSSYPALIETHLAAGFTYALRDHLDVHASLVYALPNSQRERGQGDLFSRLGKGTEMSVDFGTVAIGASWRF